MRKLLQKEILKESMRDMVRGFVSAAKTAAQTLAPEIMNPLSRVVEPFKQIKQSYSKQQPLYVLKEYLKKQKNIELIEVIGKPVVKTANPNKSWFKKINGPKNVTQIEFTARVYNKGQTRDYKAYGEAVNTPPPPTGPASPVPPAPVNNPSPPDGPASPVPPAPTNTTDKNVKTLIAEIFRTSNGLELGDIYDKTTGSVIASGTSSNKPNFKAILKYFLSKQNKPLTTTELRKVDAEKLIKLFYTYNYKQYTSTEEAKVAAKLTDPMKITEIQKYITSPTVKLAEKTNLSQKILLEQLKNLSQ